MGYAPSERSHYQTLGVPADACLADIKVNTRAQLPHCGTLFLSPFFNGNG